MDKKEEDMPANGSSQAGNICMGYFGAIMGPSFNGKLTSYSFSLS